MFQYNSLARPHYPLHITNYNEKVGLPDLVIMKGEFGRSDCDPCCNYCNPSYSPKAPVPKTGQTTCYDEVGTPRDCAGTGEDGEYQKGVASPEPRWFIDNGTVTDKLTGLMWTRDNCGSSATWQQALDYIAEMNAGTNPNYGYIDWRLPNLRELLSLVDIYGHNNPSLPDGHPFANFFAAPYWSSTSKASDQSLAWFVDDTYGLVDFLS